MVDILMSHDVTHQYIMPLLATPLWDIDNQKQIC